MPRQQTLQQGAASTEWNRVLEHMPIQKISQPGCYIDNRCGTHYRVTAETRSVNYRLMLVSIE